MATKKIIYFTAGSAVTSAEKADIAALNALTEPAYSVQVSNGAVSSGLGKTGAGNSVLETCDYVAGSAPADYGVIPTFDPDDPPAPDVGASRAVVENGQSLTIGESTYTFTITDGAITAIAVA
ncbi:hypothetical protein [Pseudaminobacter salicylatoxidans]|uniref:hypothetical protein n=1 Tax=Pseudaminobacter salicylatoxidans TaxID=93369 RepID=UPI000304DB1D|nr:hypothetical protein [Pseudaminobacter salicylatoxidans]